MTQELQQIVEGITGLFAVGGVMGVALTPVITFLKTVFKLGEGEETKFKSVVRVIFSALTCLVSGVGAVVLLGRTTVTAPIDVAIIVFTAFSAATLAYKTWWEGSKPEARIEKTAKNLV